MAGLYFSAVCPETSFSTSAKTMLQLTAASNHRVKVREWAVSFIGTSTTAQPIRVELIQGATDAGTSSSVTLRKWNPSDTETLQSSSAYNFTAEPSGTLVSILTEEVHPQSGYTWQAQYATETHIIGGGTLGIRITAAAGSSMSGRFLAEE